MFRTRVHGWLGPHEAGLATCATTQNGAIRVMSQPRYSSVISLSAAQVKQQLQKGLARQDHAYWPCNDTLMDGGLFDWSRIHGPAQLTDIYLLGLAVRHKACLVTLDRIIANQHGAWCQSAKHSCSVSAGWRSDCCRWRWVALGGSRWHWVALGQSGWYRHAEAPDCKDRSDLPDKVQWTSPRPCCLQNNPSSDFP